jgi:hypothetical protein
MVRPIHTSDRATFKKCRRRWEWSSPMHRNLRPKRQFGVAMPLYFGSAIHKAIELYYHPVLKRDPVETFATVWKEGFVNEKGEIEIEGTRLLEKLAPEWYASEIEMIEEHYELGMGMMEFYKLYSELNDDFDVVATEHVFEIPLFDNVVYKGKMDAVIRNRDTGEYGIIDHKTTAKMGEDYFEKLDMDEQCTSYIWAANQEVKLGHAWASNLDGVQIDYVLYNVLRKACPSPPTVVGSGKRLSVARSTESTTLELFEESLDRLDLWGWLESDTKGQAYHQWLKEAGDSQFIQRAIVERNQHEINHVGERIIWEAMDMTDHPKMYPNPTGDWYCLKCPFRAACLAKNDGSDYEAILRDNFELNVGR